MTTSPTKSILRHVAMCPFPFTSHPANMLLLGRKIAASSSDVQVSIFTTNPSASILSTSLSSEERAYIRIHHVDIGLPNGNPIEALRRFVEVAGESLRKAMAEAEAEVGVKITCIVAEAMVAFVCREIAEERGVKWVALWSGSAGAFAAHLYTQKLRDAVAPQGLETHQEKMVESYIEDFPGDIPLKDLPSEILGVDYNFPVARVLEFMAEHLPHATAVLVNSFPSLENPAINILTRIFHHKLLTAGPYAFTMSTQTQAQVDPYGCLPWLDAHAEASVLYICFGTGNPPPVYELVSLAESLLATGVPFLWSLPDRFRSSLPQLGSMLAGIGMVVSWAPQTSVLSHVAVGAHMTHSGWKSVLESVVTGVPLICRPNKIADNAFNTRMVGSHGWGVAVEGGTITVAGMTSILERMLRGEEGKRARDNIRAMKKLAQDAIHGSSSNLRNYIDIITT